MCADYRSKIEARYSVESSETCRRTATLVKVFFDILLYI